MTAAPSVERRLAEVTGYRDYWRDKLAALLARGADEAELEHARTWLEVSQRIVTRLEHAAAWGLAEA